MEDVNKLPRGEEAALEDDADKLPRQEDAARGEESATDGGKDGKGKKKLTKQQKKKIALITVGCFFGLIAVLVVILAPIIAVGNKVIAEDTVQPNEYLTEWMKYIDGDTPVTDLAIPGSHDSGCIEMPWYAATQDLTFAEQLERGVRYFDIRVNDKGGDLVIFHSVVNGVDYEGVLRDIDEFMDAHPSEFLVLDFSHFKNDSEEKVFDLFDEIVSAKRVVNDTNIADTEFLDALTLDDVRGKVIVFITPDETDYCGRDYFFYKNGDEVGEDAETSYASLVSPYKKLWNGKSAEKFAGDILYRYIDTFKDIDRGFFVLQCQLTDTALVFGPRYREGKLIELANDFVKGLYDDKENLQYINIVMRDFVTCEKSALTVRLNFAKGYASADSEFAAEINAFAGVE